ncbi:MAG: hypothetical protein ACJA1F_002614 [Paracoccaceae bacterium]|jgi:hypothetical protein
MSAIAGAGRSRRRSDPAGTIARGGCRGAMNKKV